MQKEKRGGARKGAGRKKLPKHLLKTSINVQIEAGKIKKIGGENAVKSLIYNTIDDAQKIV